MANLIKTEVYRPRRINSDYVGVDIGLRGYYLLEVITAACASGFLLVGYDNGVMGGLVDTPQFKNSFDQPTAGTIGNIVSLYEIGCLFGALATFLIGEPLGRRKTIASGCFFMVVGAVIQAASSTVGVMILGRIVSGLGMGAINATVPILQAETSPALSRGKLVALDLTVLNIGIVVAYFVDFGFSFSNISTSITWRLPIALQCVFIIILFLVILIIPDTPRWLAAHNRNEEAIAVLERLLDKPADSEEVTKLYTDITEAIEHERINAKSGAQGWRGLLAPGGNGKDDALQTRKRVLLACFIQAAQQLGGVNGLIYYSSTLFSQTINLGARPSAILGGCLNIALIVGSTLSIFLIDRVGRRKLLLPCISGMSMVMIVQAGLISEVQKDASWKAIGRAATAMLFIFQFLFSLGFQATVWLIPSEILPLRIRTRGSALSTSSNWIMNIAVVKFTPSAIENIGYKLYIIFAVFNAAWVPVIYFFLPETRNKTLEEVDEIFAVDGWNLHDAERREGGQNARANAAATLAKYAQQNGATKAGSGSVSFNPSEMNTSEKGETVR